MGEFLFIAKSHAPPPQHEAEQKRSLGGYDGDGFQEVVHVQKITEFHLKQLKKDFGTKKVDIQKIQSVFEGIKAGMTNEEIARRGVYGVRRIASIRATLSPTRKRQK